MKSIYIREYLEPVRGDLYIINLDIEINEDLNRGISRLVVIVTGQR